MDFLLTLHVMANLVWIGAITGVGFLLAGGAKGLDPRAAAEAAYALYRRVATPAFGLSFAAGITRMALNLDYYLKEHWFHGKLTFALAVIALHHVIGAKSRRAASGAVQPGTSGAILTGALLVSAFATVLFAIYKRELVR